MDFTFNFSVGKKVSRIEKILSFYLRVQRRTADDCGNAIAFLCNFFSCIFTAVNEIVELKEVERWIAAHGKLSKNNEVSFFFFGPLNGLPDLETVFFKITDRVVELGESDFHGQSGVI